MSTPGVTTKKGLDGLVRTFGTEIVQKIQCSKILVVGSGGIGCELLKNLALSGFQHVEVIDLDTIDVSNLNRQLLFRSPHVGKAKCIVGCEVASSMVPPASSTIVYKAHHGNVCDNTKFNVPFVSSFDLVLNALDNVEARRRVNRLCLASNVPLIEAGTTGYLGQVTVIHKPSTVACYECKTQETQKVYPICTIRSTPSMPVHTIVWAKELYKLFFTSKVEESMLYEDPSIGSAANDDNTTDDTNNDKINDTPNTDTETNSEPSTYMPTVENLRKLLTVSTSSKDTNSSSLEDLKASIQDTLIALYCKEIIKQIEMGRYKAAKKTPKPLDAKIILDGMAQFDRQASSNSNSTTTTSQTIWSPVQCIAECTKCLIDAASINKNAQNAEENQDHDIVLQSFDKDNDLCMKFVTATSNLRSYVFGIEPLQSPYSAKGIAGNIIPAIATTNAICAGIQILQVFQILKKQYELQKTKESADKTELNLQDVCCYVNCIRNKTRNGMYLTASSLEKPNPNCFVCRNANVPISLDVKQWTLQEFLQRIIKSKLGFDSPTIALEGDIIWEEGDGADSTAYLVNSSKLLSKLPCGGIQHGTVVEIEDFSQDLTVHASIIHKENWDDQNDTDESRTKEDYPFLVGGSIPKATAVSKSNSENSSETPSKTTTVSSHSKKVEDEDDDDVVILLDDDDNNKPAATATSTNHGNKRSVSETNNNGDVNEPTAKKSRLEVIEID